MTHVTPPPEPARESYAHLAHLERTRPFTDELSFALDEIDRLRRTVGLMDRALARALARADGGID